jgi:CubicO group peptidase (beta-lactamase class C family)
MSDTAGLAEQIQAKVSELAEEHGVVGVAVGILYDGQEHYAYHGVTSIENPLPVDEKTYFQFGSTGKTYTATAMMRLVDQGKVDLDATVRTYLPDFKLKDEDVAAKVTVRHLFNHTAGWEGDMMDDTGPGDDALQKYVERMVRLEQVSPLGESVSYNNASLSVAGLIIERIMGTTYEQAMKDLIFEPLGLTETLIFPNDIMTRRFVVGHNRENEDTVKIARPWWLPRGNCPAGGISSNARDQLAWARFHLGDGTADDGTRILAKELLDLMKQPTAEMKGSALGDYVGISWLMRDVDGVRLVGHGGTTNGQHSEFVTVPERGFALISMTNTGPSGPQLNHDLEKWALETILGLTVPEPEPIALGDAALAVYAGTYETIAAVCEISADSGRLSAKVTIKPHFAAMLRESGEEVPDEQPPVPLALLSSEGDQYVVPEGPGKGMRGYFTRDGEGNVVGVHLGGRLATRVVSVPEQTDAGDGALTPA